MSINPGAAGAVTFANTNSKEALPVDYHRSFLEIRNTSTDAGCTITLSFGTTAAVDYSGIVLNQNDYRQFYGDSNVLTSIQAKVVAGGDATKARLSYQLGRNQVPGAPA